MLSSSKDDPPPSSSKDDPQSSLEKLAVIYLQDNHAGRLEWCAFDVSDDPKLNQILPPRSLRYANHRLTPSLHEDDESESKVYLKPIATASNDQNWSVMRAILDNYLYRFLENDPSLTQRFGGNLVERICIKDMSPNSASKWEPVDSMPILVFAVHALVLGGKLYCLGGVDKDRPWAVAYDPDKAKWQYLPDPPHRPYSVRTIFSASLEKSTFVEAPCIVVGSPDDGVLQIYIPDTQRWFTQSFDIKDSSIGLDDLVGDGGHPLVVDNNLYWYSVRSGEILCAYDLLTNVWSMARLPIHDEEEYFSHFEPHFPPSLAHLGSDKFCLFWVSPLPVEPRDNEAFLLPKPEDFSTRLHCLKFRVTTFAGNLPPNSKVIIPLDVSIMSCQSHLVSGGKDFRGGFGVDGHLGSNSSDVIPITHRGKMEGQDVSEVAEQTQHELQSLLCGEDRDFLIRNNSDDQVKIDNLKGKKVGLYFSASWCGPCHRFTPNLVEVYNELFPKGDFEIVFVSADKDDEAFKAYFSKMPWLAIPFSDSNTRDQLDKIFKVMGIPYLVILDEDGKVITEDGVEFIREYGVDAYPFTQERIKEIKDEEEKAKREQPLKFLLGSRSRDFVLSANGNQVPISKLEGNTIGLYFAQCSQKKCAKFTPKLLEIYEKLKANGGKFEVVMIPFDNKEESFKEGFDKLPWLSLPFNDKSCIKLARYFEIPTIPALAIIGPDGKTLQSDVVDAIEDHGIETYPFTPEKFSLLAEKDKAKRDAQTLESILVLGDLNFVIGKDGLKVPISDLVGKNILIYFSAHWCPPCRAFLPKLVETYHQIKAKDDAFELIFISSDKDQTSFEDYFSQMPWLALPFEDERQDYLDRIFKVQGIPTLVAIGPTGRTVTTEAHELVMYHGADAYPFTETRLKEIEAEEEEMAKGWPKKVKLELHEHELELIRRRQYGCDGCKEGGKVWSFYCEECDYDLHPKCALEENKATKGDNEDTLEEGATTKEGWVCDGDVCHKA